MTILLLVIGFLFLFAATDVGRKEKSKVEPYSFESFLIGLCVILGATLIYLAAYISQSH